MIARFVLAASLVLALTAPAAWAQSTPAAPTAAAPAPAGGAMAPAGKMSGKPRSAKSLACSADADKQGLHGKPRKTFMSKCKSGKS